MTNEQLPQNEKDAALWEIAKKRTNFKRSLVTYVIINIFLWCLWYFRVDNYAPSINNWPWPLWVTLGWGLGLAFQYSDAYISPKSISVQNEYEKLKKNQNK